MTTRYVCAIDVVKKMNPERIASIAIYAHTLPIWKRVILRVLWWWPCKYITRRYFYNPWVLCSVVLRPAAEQKESVIA